jgi:hypothetical protein
MVPYCEHFYPQVTKQTIKELQHLTEEEIKQMLQTPMALQKMVEKTGIKLKFNPPTTDHIKPDSIQTRIERPIKQQQPNTNNRTRPQNTQIPNNGGKDSGSTHQHQQATTQPR